MKSKEELIKQVIILSITLLVVIIMAVVLNAGKGNKEIPEIKVQNSQTQNTNSNSNNSKDEMMENLKGLLEPTTKNEFQDSGTIKQPIETGVKEQLKTSNNETIQYKEIWYGDN